MDLQDQVEIEASRGVSDASPRAVHGSGHHVQGEKVFQQTRATLNFEGSRQLVGSTGERAGITLNFDISHDTLEADSPWVPCSSETNADFDDCLYSETMRVLAAEFGCWQVLHYRMTM